MMSLMSTINNKVHIARAMISCQATVWNLLSQSVLTFVPIGIQNHSSSDWKHF